jgi:antitoxin (DNA-binding transcriptional repressor) of toxin-antitoxin stability system
MKRVSIVEAEKQHSTLVAEAEKGREIAISRDGSPMAELVQVKPAVNKPYTPEEVARRRKALVEIRAIADTLDVRLTRDEIKARIREGQR